MSGALLETAGQVRNSFPYIVRKSLQADLELISTVPSIDVYSRVPILETIDIPFDYGPDKAGRIYLVINGFGAVITADTYAAAGILAGDIYFQDTSGIEYHLLSLGDALPNARGFNTSKIIGIYTPIFSSRPDVIGYFVWRNVATAPGLLDNVVARCTINVGYYGDYAEYDFDNLKKCEHHHYHGIKDDGLVNMTKV